MDGPDISFEPYNTNKIAPIDGSSMSVIHTYGRVVAMAEKTEAVLPSIYSLRPTIPGMTFNDYQGFDIIGDGHSDWTHYLDPFEDVYDAIAGSWLTILSLYNFTPGIIPPSDSTQSKTYTNYQETIDNVCDQVSSKLPEFGRPGMMISGEIGCTRKYFTSKTHPETLSPITCCFKDANNAPSQMNSTKADTDDYKDRKRYYTCAYEHRNLSGNTCKNMLFEKTDKNFCYTGTIDEIYNKWTTGEKNCYYAYQRNVSAVPDEGFGTSSGDETVPVYQPVDKNLIRNYPFAVDKAKKLKEIIDNNSAGKLNLTASIDSTDYHPLNEVIFQLCKDYPFACKDFLTQECNAETPESLATSPNKLRWCGCNLQDNLYTKFYNLPKECTPMCNRDGVIPDSGLNLKPKQCYDTNLCIIDSLNVIYTQTKGSGDINIKQMCGGCDGNCQCRIEDNTFVLNNKMFKTDLNLNEICGSQTLFKPGETSKKTSTFLYVLILMIIGFVLLIFIGNMFT